MSAAPDPELRFEREALLAEARRQAGLADFGGSDFLEPLEVLLRTYDAHYTTAKGRGKAHRRLVRLLATRLRISDALRRHPEIHERPIARPMVLTGLPRSGTSALFNLLACDPSARALLLWETQFPDPLDDQAPDGPDPRRAAVEAYSQAGRDRNPDFARVHFASADTPEECVLLQAHSLSGVHHGAEPLLEPYRSWYRAQDLHGLYAYHRTLLQLLDWQRPGERWLLKSPAHMWGIDCLIDTFPDVSIVWSHRDPLASMASVCSLTHLLMRDRVEIPKPELGPIVLDFYATSLERGLAERERQDPARFVDVGHDELVADPLGVAERIHARFGLPLSAEARRAMRAHVGENPRERHGRHEYRLEDWGLARDAVLARFAPYLERFGIELA